MATEYGRALEVIPTRTQGPRGAAILNLRVDPGYEVAMTRAWLRIQDGVKKVSLGSIHLKLTERLGLSTQNDPRKQR